ncbi:MAG TPA: spore coat U domain-containing protein [Rhizomicrobium sp.]|nr:spore coat U domain-containing protein [Rhizomicrobium sp.]
MTRAPARIAAICFVLSAFAIPQAFADDDPAPLNDSVGAGTATATLNIQATIMASCSVTGNTLDFGQASGVRLFAGVSATQRPQTTINVLCTKGVNYQVGIGDGSNVSGGQRRLVNNGNYMSYELYKSLTGSDRFGDADTSQRVSGTSTGSSVGVPVFGQIMSGTTVPAGQYLDTATITVYF